MTGAKRDWISPREPQGRTAAVAQDLERIFGDAGGGEASPPPRRRPGAAQPPKLAGRRAFRISPAMIGGVAALTLLGVAFAMALAGRGSGPATVEPPSTPLSPASTEAPARAVSAAAKPSPKLAPPARLDLAQAPALLPEAPPAAAVTGGQVARREIVGREIVGRDAARRRAVRAQVGATQAARPQAAIASTGATGREAATTTETSPEERAEADAPCAGLSLPARVRCLYPTVVSADQELRQAYDAAVRARVEPAVLLRYQDLWESLRRRSSTEPQRVIDGYRDMARALDQMASDGRPRS